MTMKKLIILMIMTLALLVLVGCGKEKQAAQEKLNWSVVVLEQQMKTKLEQVDEVKQYDGSIAKVQHTKKPGEGKQFLLLQLELKKNVAGNNGFAWDRLVLQGKEAYKRTEDVFLSDYKYKRLPATELKLDAKGWVCFEVPVTVKSNELKLVYKEQDKQQMISLK